MPTQKQNKTNITAVCGYCKQKGSIELYDTEDMYGDTFHVNQCVQCQAIYLHPRPTAAQLDRAYSESYYGEQDDKFSPFIEKILDYFRGKRARLIKKYVAAPAKVLDIGCGNGRFLQYLLKEGNYETYGVELAGKAAERAAAIPQIHLKKGRLEHGDFEAESLDAVTLFHVFEHLDEPIKTLEIASNILKKDGILVMSFPNIDSLQSNMFKGKWLHLDPPRHLFFFKPRDFVTEMKNYGFELVQETHFCIEQNPFGMQQSLLNKMTKKREVLYEYLKGNEAYVNGHSKLNLFAQRSFFTLSYPLFVISDALESAFGKGATVEFVFKKK